MFVVSVTLYVGAFSLSVHHTHHVFSGLLYLQNLLVQLQALALDEVAGRGGHLIRQIPQSTQGKLKSGVHYSHHGLLLHDSQQLLLDGARERRKT